MRTHGREPRFAQRILNRRSRIVLWCRLEALGPFHDRRPRVCGIVQLLTSRSHKGDLVKSNSRLESSFSARPALRSKRYCCQRCGLLACLVKVHFVRTAEFLMSKLIRVVRSGVVPVRLLPRAVSTLWNWPKSIVGNMELNIKGWIRAKRSKDNTFQSRHYKNPQKDLDVNVLCRVMDRGLLYLSN